MSNEQREDEFWEVLGATRHKGLDWPPGYFIRSTGVISNSVAGASGCADLSGSLLDIDPVVSTG